MTLTQKKSTIAICDTQPIATEGIRTLLSGSEELQFLTSVDTLRTAFEIDPDGQEPGASLLLIRPLVYSRFWSGSGCLRDAHASTAAVVWGNSISEPEAPMRFFQLGARGIIRKTAELGTLLSCLHSVAAGSTWNGEIPYSASRSSRPLSPIRTDAP